MHRLEFALDHPTQVGVCALLTNDTRPHYLFLIKSRELNAPLFDALREKIAGFDVARVI